MDNNSFVTSSCSRENLLRVCNANMIHVGLKYCGSIKLIYDVSPCFYTYSKHRVAMKVTKHQRKRVNENERRIGSNKELLSYPYLSVVRKLGSTGSICRPHPLSPLKPDQWSLQSSKKVTSSKLCQIGSL